MEILVQYMAMVHAFCTEIRGASITYILFVGTCREPVTPIDVQFLHDYILLELVEIKMCIWSWSHFISYRLHKSIFNVINR